MFRRRKIRDLLSIESSRAFCMVPWVHLFVSQLGTVVPCCLTSWEKDQALGDVNSDTIVDIWNGNPMRKFRRRMLKDKKDSRCWQCYENENNGLKSKRNMVNFLYADKIQWVNDTSRSGYSETSKPVYWDIRISNLCNLKCRICGHHSSSSWFDDAKTVGLYTHKDRLHRGPKDFDKILKQLIFFLPDVEEVYFAGGEPLIMAEHLQMLRLFLKEGRRDIKLRYATNFSQTIFKGQDFFKLWREFDHVYIHASLDGMGLQGELQRSGQNWKSVESERQRMLEVCPQVNFMVTPTISIFNIFQLANFHRDWTVRGLIEIDEFMPHMLKSPEYYSIRILPKKMKLQAEENLYNHIQWIKKYVESKPPKKTDENQSKKWVSRMGWLKVNNVTGYTKLDMLITELTNTITYLNSKDQSNLIPDFIRNCEQLDALRGDKTKQTFPELAALWQS